MKTICLNMLFNNMAGCQKSNRLIKLATYSNKISKLHTQKTQNTIVNEKECGADCRVHTQ